MSDRIKLNSDDYPSNSKFKKEEKEERTVKKVIKGTASLKKPSFGKKIAEAFTGDESQGVMNYILYDILIPAAKSMLYDMVTGGMEMKLFGTSNGRNSRSRSSGKNGSYVSYDNYYDDKDRKRRDERERREPARGSRNRREEITFDSRAEAREVYNHLVDFAYDYGDTSVADLYDLAGITSESDHTDRNYGWTSKDINTEPNIRIVRDGFLLIMPPARPIN